MHSRPTLPRFPLGRRRSPLMLGVVAITALILATVSPPALAEDLRITGVASIAPQTSADSAVRFDVSWRNGWHDERNHDGVWIFARYRGQTLPFAAEGHRVMGMDGGAVGASVVVADDGLGLWVVPDPGHRGDLAVRVIAALQPAEDSRQRTPIDVYGIEMVHVPAGGFWIGDPDPKAREYGGFHRAGTESGAEGLIRIDDESAIEVGGPGQLTYAPGNSNYAGDGAGPIPAGFPKGTEPFWVMKYELTEGQYADFLADLPAGATFERARIGGRDYYDHGGSIRLVDGWYVAEHPDRPARYLSWDDQLAFTDWAGLRPMTELEFTKAARGPRTPLAREFPWGTASRDRLVRLSEPSGELVHLDGRDEAALTLDTLDVYGASYYRVMDLAGSVWERVISVGSPDGRAFVGSHGDGRLGAGGTANNDDWPHGHAGRNGHGYRGGGYYGPDAAWHEFNPFSPVSYRRFGGWAGHAPSRAYGYRAVRSAR